MRHCWTAAAAVGLAVLLCAASCDETRPQSPTEAAAAQPKESPMPSPRPAADAPVFSAQVAGGFYPAEPQVLREMVTSLLATARSAARGRPGADLLGLVAPHAGYPYSGPVAASAFALLTPGAFARVVVLAPAHRRLFSPPAALDAGAYRTPLGDIPIDRRGVRALVERGVVRADEEKFRGEHALEVELPYLQLALGDGWQLVPLMLSRGDPEQVRALGRALREVFPAGDTLFVASTDLSHDYAYEVATAMDENAVRLVAALDVDGLLAADAAFRRAENDIHLGADGRLKPACAQLCGLSAVLTLLEVVRAFGPAEAAVLDRRNSGDVIGDKRSRIVGYGALAIGLKTARPAAAAKAGAEDEKHTGSTGDFLSAEEKRELLSIARQTLTAQLRDGGRPDFSPASAALRAPGAAFVTLKKHGELRGCIGYMEPADPLWQMVRDRAIDAAVHDSRFPPVREAELADIQIEISVLSPRVRVTDPLRDIAIGRDGVWLELGMRRGVFLPQVPVEQGWTTVEEYLDHLCQKAGIYERGCWRAEGAVIQRFTALVFGEE